MAIQQLSRGFGAGENLGTSLGQGLASLLQNRMNKMQQRKIQQNQAAGLASLLGITPEQAQPLTSLGTPLLTEILKQGMLEDFGSVQPQQVQGNLMEQGIGQPSDQIQQYDQTQQPDQISEVMRALQMFTSNPMDQGVRQFMQQQPNQMQQPMFEPNNTINTPVEKKMARDIGSIKPVPKKMTKAQALIARKEELNNANELKKEQAILNKDNKPSIKKIMEDYKTAIDENKDLDRMEQLIATKNLTRPRLAAAIKTLSKGIFGLGIDLSSLMSPESQEFDKISMGFLRNLKSYFGARITQIEVENFLKTVPSSLQTREGKRRVIYNLRINNEAKQLRRKALGKLRSKYGNNIPGDVNELVEDMISPQLDILASKFKEGMPQKTSKEKTWAYKSRILSPSTIARKALNRMFGKG